MNNRELFEKLTLAVENGQVKTLQEQCAALGITKGKLINRMAFGGEHTNWVRFGGRHILFFEDETLMAEVCAAMADGNLTDYPTLSYELKKSIPGIKYNIDKKQSYEKVQVGRFILLVRKYW